MNNLVTESSCLMLIGPEECRRLPSGAEAGWNFEHQTNDHATRLGGCVQEIAAAGTPTLNSRASRSSMGGTMGLYNSLERIAMLTIRGADQVCTSLRAARKSLGDGKTSSNSRIEELDLLIGELAVGTKSYVGDPVKSKQQIESFVALLSQPNAQYGEGSEVKSDTLSPGVDAALAHLRRAVATLQRIMTTEAPVLQSS